MIKIKENNKKNIEIQQVISSNSKRETEIEIFIPKNLDFKKSLTSSDFFEKNITQKKSLYKSKNPSLTLLYAKYLKNKDLPKEQLTTSLRLFSYQFLQKIKNHKSEIKKEKNSERIADILTEIEKTLNSFREFEADLSDEDALDVFEKIDFLLSFEVEQFFLGISNKINKIDILSESNEHILLFAQKERVYRKTKGYNKNDKFEEFIELKDKSNKKARDKVVRVINKMDMNKRIIELPLKVSEKIFQLGKKEKYVSLGLSTGIIMFCFGLILYQARALGFDSTFQFVIALTVMYIFRDLFREEFKNYIFNKIASVKPQLKSLIYVPNKSHSVGITKTWFSKKGDFSFKETNYKDKFELSLREYIKLNDFEHHGFKRMRTYTSINLSSIMNEIIRDDKHLFVYDDDIVKKIDIPRQYKLTLKIKETVTQKPNFSDLLKIKEPKITYQKHTIIINRNGIVDTYKNK